MTRCFTIKFAYRNKNNDTEKYYIQYLLNHLDL